MNAPAQDEPGTLEERRYFLTQFHFVADQRLKTFGFYFVITAATLGWTVNTFISAESPMPERTRFILAIAGLFHAIIGTAFYLLDRRSLTILSNIEESMLELEVNEADTLQTFTKDLEFRSRVRETRLWNLQGRQFVATVLDRFASFRWVLGTFFGLQILLGLSAFFLFVANVGEP